MASPNVAERCGPTEIKRIGTPASSSTRFDVVSSGLGEVRPLAYFRDVDAPSLVVLVHRRAVIEHALLAGKLGIRDTLPL